jgi:hypothetical protein
MKARIYRLFAFVFAGTGLMLFLFMFFYRTQGNIMAIADDPLAVVILAFPFIPAFVFSLISRKAEVKLRKLLEEPETKTPVPLAAVPKAAEKPAAAKKVEKLAKAKKTSP